MTGPGKGVTGLLRRKNPHLLPIVKRWQAKERKLFTVKGGGMFVGWLLNVPATGECISGTDLLRQFYVLPH